MKNTLVFLTSGFPFGTGETFIESEIQYLSDAFHSVTIIAINPCSNKQRPVPTNCTIKTLHIELNQIDKLCALTQFKDIRLWNEFRVVKQLYNLKLSKEIIKVALISLYRSKLILKYLKKLTVDSQSVFYSYWCDDAALALALLKQQQPKIKTVSRVHGWDVYCNVHKLNYLPFRHFIADNLNLIISVSQSGKDYIHANWKIIKSNNVIVSKLGVKQQQYTGIPSIFTLVSCSNLIPLKRVHMIINALALIKNQPIKWVHFGDGPELNTLITRAKNLLHSNTDWEFKGRIPNTDVLEWYANYSPSVFINVSSSEGIPVSIMEAMSFGIPVIATNVGGNREIVNDVNGICLDANCTPNEIAKAIQSFSNLEYMNSCRKGAYQTWEREYNAKTNYKKFVQYLLK